MENPLHVPRVPVETWRRDGDGQEEWFASSSGETAWELPPGATLEEGGAEPGASGARRGGRSRRSGEPGAAAPADADAAASDAGGEALVAMDSAPPTATTWRTDSDGAETWFVNTATKEVSWVLPPGGVVVS